MDKKYDKVQVGQRLKEFRKRIRMNQKDFANSLNWTHDSYRKIETGKVMITSDRIQELYETYNIDVCYLLTGEHYSSHEIDPDTLVNIYVCSSEEEWINMNLRLLEYQKKLKRY